MSAIIRAGVVADARALRALGEAVVPAAGEEPLWLEHVDGNEPARAFYGRRGFVEVERVPQGPYPDDVWMRREP
jgi:GNAT superfamily N-acetyltransferase